MAEWVITGEHGPELVTFATGGVVHTMPVLGEDVPPSIRYPSRPREGDGPDPDGVPARVR